MTEDIREGAASLPKAPDVRNSILRHAQIVGLRGATEHIEDALRLDVTEYKNACGGTLPLPEPLPEALEDWVANVVHFAAMWTEEATPDSNEYLRRAVIGYVKAKRRDSHLAAAWALDGKHLPGSPAPSNDEQFHHLGLPAPTTGSARSEDLRERRIRLIAADVERHFDLTGARARHVATAILYEDEAEQAQEHADAALAAAVGARRAAQMTTRGVPKKDFVETILAVTRPAEDATRRAYPAESAEE